MTGPDQPKREENLEEIHEVAEAHEKSRHHYIREAKCTKINIDPFFDGGILERFDSYLASAVQLPHIWAHESTVWNYIDSFFLCVCYVTGSKTPEF